MIKSFVSISKSTSKLNYPFPSRFSGQNINESSEHGMRQIGAYLLIILNIRRFITKIVRLPKAKWFHPNAQGFNEQ